MTREIKVTDGYYWRARTPDGRWSVFWWHPRQGDWHRLIASFSTEERAEGYVFCENECLEDTLGPRDDEADIVPKALPPPTRIPQALEGKRLPPLRLSPDFASDLIEALPELFERHPDGVTSDAVMNRFGTKYLDVLDAMRWLHSIGAGQWVHLRGRPGNKKVLLPPDVEVEEQGLTERQERVLEIMRRYADDYGCVNKVLKDIAFDASVSPGSISQILYALEKKGFLMLAKPASRNGLQPAIYQILENQEGGSA